MAKEKVLFVESGDCIKHAFATGYFTIDKSYEIEGQIITGLELLANADRIEDSYFTIVEVA